MMKFNATPQAAHQPSITGQTLAVAVVKANRHASPFAGGYVS